VSFHNHGARGKQLVVDWIEEEPLPDLVATEMLKKVIPTFSSFSGMAVS